LDSELLLCSKRWPRSIFLTCLGLEELGKASLCLTLCETGESIETKERVTDFWRCWRCHLSKGAWGQGYVAWNPEVLQRLAALYLPDGYEDWNHYESDKRDFYGRYSEITNAIKMASLYVDVLRPRSNSKSISFRLPSATLKEDFARRMWLELKERVDDVAPQMEKLGRLNLPPYPPDMDLWQ